jgi:kynurenine formamidase
MGRQRFVDLSIAIESNLPSDPPIMIPKIDYMGHVAGAEQMKEFFPGVTTEQLPNGLGWALEFLTLTTHSGTHLDAPYHYHPTMDRGKPSLTIDEVPLEWCFSDGVVLDFRHKADGERITVKDLERELDRIAYEVKPLDIVLIQTGADAAWGTPEYLVKGAGMDRESTLFLTEKGIKVVGIDAWSWDRPLPFLAKEFHATGDSKVIWEAHFAGIEIGFCHMEKLANLSAIGRSYGFTVCCFPIKIKRASAGWCRPVAIVED